MMNSPEPKRTLTEQMQLDTDTTNASRTDGYELSLELRNKPPVKALHSVEDDLFARLRGVGSRVRSSRYRLEVNEYKPLTNTCRRQQRLP
jgi:hypothetical protein